MKWKIGRGIKLKKGDKKVNKKKRGKTCKGMKNRDKCQTVERNNKEEIRDWEGRRGKMRKGNREQGRGRMTKRGRKRLRKKKQRGGEGGE